MLRRRRAGGAPLCTARTDGDFVAVVTRPFVVIVVVVVIIVGVVGVSIGWLAAYFPIASPGAIAANV
jgi:hypothetical protein